jgi:hypothetical protein
VANGLDRAKIPGPQRRDRDRQGVVRIVLVAPARAQHTGACRQGGGHVEHMFAGGDELLGQQVAHAIGALDGPHTRRERRRPRQQLVDLDLTRPDPLVRELLLGGADRHRGVRRLVGVDTDDHLHGFLRGYRVGGTAAGTPASGSVRVLSRATPRRSPDRAPFVRQPDPTLGAGRHFVSHLDRDLSNATKRPQRPSEVSSRHLRDMPPAALRAFWDAASSSSASRAVDQSDREAAPWHQKRRSVLSPRARRQTFWCR